MAPNFGTLTLPDDLHAHAVTLCGKLNLTSTELFCKWEAWALSTSISADLPTTAQLDQLATSIRQKAAKLPSTTSPTHSRRKSAVYNPPAPPKAINIDDFFSIVGETAPNPDDTQPEQTFAPTSEPSSPTQPKLEPESPSQPSAKARPAKVIADIPGTALPADDLPDDAYAQRPGSGRVEATHVPTEPVQPTTPTPALTITLQPTLPNDVRYMNDELHLRRQALSTRINDQARSILQRIAATNDLEQPPTPLPPQAFQVASPDIIYAVGRIRVELDETEGIGAGRINQNSVLLEAPQGNVVKLDLTRIHEDKRPLFLNPGMVVVVQGVNTNGSTIDVHAIYDNCIPPSVHPDKPSASDEQPPDGISANVISAMGPFTTASNLRYEPLDDLLAIVQRNTPDFVVLSGPFVDSRHSLINDSLPVQFETIFATRILTRISTCAQTLREQGNPCRFILLPSLEDAHLDFVCPQPAFSWPKNVAPNPDIILTTNPSIINVSAKDAAYRAVIGATSLPSVLDVSSDSICWNLDRFTAISSHLVKQQSFYPTFPPSSGVPLDTTLMNALKIPSYDTAGTVDCLIAPSRLKAFVKCVDAGAVVVNPGLLCRGIGGGTYAEISLPLHRSKSLRPSDFIESRTEVNIVRL